MDTRLVCDEVLRIRNGISKIECEIKNSTNLIAESRENIEDWTDELKSLERTKKRLEARLVKFCNSVQ